MTNETKTPRQRMGSSPPDNKPNRDALPPHRRFLPIEADDALRQQILADQMIDPEHLGTLNDFILLRTSDEEKDRVFLSTLGPESADILDDLMEVAIREMQVEQATVVGLASVIITRALDLCIAIQRQELGRLIVLRRSSEGIR
ncbi:hypothetical protein [Bradyrhizobium erythrophlei]|uniref:Uncharacterized protein n=1 Tax=Bradyrhizobium erythrophlei TaxID=1437360 RepID=A0A1M5YP10_9BRAD|nr:hypothetical protein [Bradyrhizobium erythrophlei]SHI13594.1 hypothetical protein SAMN05443248_8563 [Bradyrhizobium erythrophlei]